MPIVNHPDDTPVLIVHLEGATKAIRVGSGGVMLPNKRRWWLQNNLGPWMRSIREESI